MVNYPRAALCARLSQAVYEAFNDSFRFADFPEAVPEFIDRETTDTQVAIAFDEFERLLYIAFRGSEKRRDWYTNLEFDADRPEFIAEVVRGEIISNQEKSYPYEDKSASGVEMHSGFARAYLSVRDRLFELLNERSPAQLILTGHSLGGALATLCASDVRHHFSELNLEIYTFGSPRVGNRNFSQLFNQRIRASYRFVYGMDIVPALPRPWQGYQHVDEEYRLGTRFSLRFFSRQINDHAIANYVKSLENLAS